MSEFGVYEYKCGIIPIIWIIDFNKMVTYAAPGQYEVSLDVLDIHLDKDRNIWYYYNPIRSIIDKFPEYEQPIVMEFYKNWIIEKELLDPY